VFCHPLSEACDLSEVLVDVGVPVVKNREQTDAKLTIVNPEESLCLNYPIWPYMQKI
jgi:hypothetical protein